MHTILISLGQLVGSDISKTLAEFVRLTSNELVQQALPKLSGSIDQFKRGKITEQAFFLSVQELLPTLTLEQCVDAWNAMAIPTPEVIADLRKLQNLQERLGFEITIIGVTNITHQRCIFSTLAANDIHLSTKACFSNVEGTLAVSALIDRASLDQPERRVTCLMDNVKLDFEYAWHEMVSLKRKASVADITRFCVLKDQSFQRLLAPKPDQIQLSLPIVVTLPEKQVFDLESLIQNTSVSITKSEEKGGPINVQATTPRLWIRPVNEQDIDFYQQELWGNPSVMAKFGGGNTRYFWPGTEAEGNINYAAMRIAQSEYSWMNRWQNDNPWAGYTVLHRNTGERLGHVVVGGGELAYLFKEDVWGQGYGSEAVAALTNVIVPSLIKAGYSPGVSELNATVRLDHISSQRVMEKSGFETTFEVNLRQFGDNWFERYDYKAPVIRLQQTYEAAIAKKQALDKLTPASGAIVLYQPPKQGFPLQVEPEMSQKTENTGKVKVKL